MSDFLDQFTNKNYKKSASENSSAAAFATEIQTSSESGLAPDSENTFENDSENASESVSSISAESALRAKSEDPSNQVPKIDAASKKAAVSSPPPKTPAAESFSGVKSTEHEVVIDTTYNMHKTIRIVSVCAAVLLFCVGIFFAYLFLSRIPMMDFAGKTLDEANTWALKTGIELDEQYRYDLGADSGTILTQSVAAGEMIARNSIVRLEISKGPDPNEKIAVPDFSTMTVPEMQEWIDKNRLLNTQFQEENSSTIEKGKFIRAEYRDLSVDAEHFTRVDYLILYVSKGLEGITQNVLVPDLSGMAKTAADSWAQSNNITLLYTPQLSETVAQDVVISQNKSAGITIPSGSTLELALSAGPGILIPDYSKIMKEDAPAAESALTPTVKSVYSFTVGYGKLISQSVPAGTRVFTANNKIVLTYSEGKPYIDNLKGSSEKDIAAYFYGFKLKGVTIPYVITYVDSSEEKGKVVAVSRYNEFLNSAETISITISRGNLTPP